MRDPIWKIGRFAHDGNHGTRHISPSRKQQFYTTIHMLRKGEIRDVASSEMSYRNRGVARQQRRFKRRALA